MKRKGIYIAVVLLLISYGVYVQLWRSRSSLVAPPQSVGSDSMPSSVLSPSSYPYQYQQPHPTQLQQGVGDQQATDSLQQAVQADDAGMREWLGDSL